MWLAVQTRSRAEKMVALLLQNKGYEVFLPTRVSDGRGVQRRAEPLFPGYLFCRALNLTHGLIVTTPGVRSVVSCNGQPVGVSETEIENIRLLLRSNLPLRQWDSLESGDEIRLVSGPLAGCRGIVTHRAEGHDFVVSVEILGRSIAVKVEVDWIKPVLRLGQACERKGQALAAAG